MNKENSSRNEYIHLYNPEKEGCSSYDMNYTNALRKSRKLIERSKFYSKNPERYAA